jgi:bifunctional non-homologous end joining protein LigD
MPDGDHVTVAGIRVSNPGRVLYEELGLTKAALARYYESVAEWMLPELRQRPLSLVRCPAGPGEGCFYQKNIDAKFPAEIERVPVALGGGGLYAAVDSAAAVVGLVQMGVIELHAWGATTRDLDRPDRMILDLDPAPELPWRTVMAAAHHTRERLDDLGLESFVKTTGGKGLHVVVPLTRRHDWDEVKAFSRALAESIAAERPQDFTPKASKRERAGRIYIDWLRNGEGATAIAPYSVRARPGAPVATPLHWDEVGGRMKPEKYHVKNVAKRLQGLHSDPWKQLRRKPQAITAAMKRKLEITP